MNSRQKKKFSKKYERKKYIYRPYRLFKVDENANTYMIAFKLHNGEQKRIKDSYKYTPCDLKLVGDGIDDMSDDFSSMKLKDGTVVRGNKITMAISDKGEVYEQKAEKEVS